jgi:two-component system, OmpR family, response regulator VicR
LAARILIVDDEPLIVKGLRFSLEQEGFLVDEATDGLTALDKCKSEEYQLILLDVMLPHLSGIDVLRQMRETSDVPVIMRTAKGEDMDRILGLEYGADDYMVKPFNILEVKARIKSVLRRTSSKKQVAQSFSSNGLTIDISSRSVRRDQTEIDLTAKEFNLLWTMASQKGRVFSREELHDTLWRNEKDVEGYDLRTVDVHIRRLREKLEVDPANPKYIMTKWGVGYYFAGR